MPKSDNQKAAEALKFLRESGCTMRQMPEAESELRAMLSAIERDASGLFKLGKFTASKKLSNGYRVRISITSPQTPEVPTRRKRGK